eukprot:859191-Prorocentrum_minimum.AAC.8
MPPGPPQRVRPARAGVGDTALAHCRIGTLAHAVLVAWCLSTQRDIAVIMKRRSEGTDITPSVKTLRSACLQTLLNGGESPPPPLQLARSRRPGASRYL